MEGRGPRGPSSNTMPGPDGIPYKAWRNFGSMAVDIFYNVTTALSSPHSTQLLREAFHDETADETHTYNLGTLICLPKKPTGHDDDIGMYFTPERYSPAFDNQHRQPAGRQRCSSSLGIATAELDL